MDWSAARVLAFIAALVFSVPATGRELAVPAEELIAVEIVTVALVHGADAPVVLLREPESGEVIPIFIGHAEARAILFALRGIKSPRPTSHDLMHDMIAKLSATLEGVIVDDLRDGTYHGALELRIDPGGRRLLVDARPSDALALAVRAGAAIRVAPKVLHAERGFEFEGLGPDQAVTALGITVVEATRELRDALELPDERGVIASSATGLAAYAGIQAGALIMRVNDDVPDNPMHFLELVRKTPQGQQASIVFWHDGRQQTVMLRTDVPAAGTEPGVPL